MKLSDFLKSAACSIGGDNTITTYDRLMVWTFLQATFSHDSKSNYPHWDRCGTFTKYLRQRLSFKDKLPSHQTF